MQEEGHRHDLREEGWRTQLVRLWAVGAKTGRCPGEFPAPSLSKWVGDGDGDRDKPGTLDAVQVQVGGAGDLSLILRRCLGTSKTYRY